MRARVIFWVGGNEKGYTVGFSISGSNKFAWLQSKS